MTRHGGRGRAIVAWLAIGLLVGCGRPASNAKPVAKNSPAGQTVDSSASSESRPEGTGRDVVPEGGGENVAANKSVPDKSPSTPPAGASESAAPAAPDSPDAAVLAVLKGVRENHPEAVWDFLPASMQHNLNEAVREFGRSIDAELWSRSMELLRKIVRIFETKKEFIFENPQWKTAERIDTKEIQAHWDDLVGLLSTIVNSELSDVERLKTFDGRAFLASTGAKVMESIQTLSKSVKESPVGLLQDIKVTTKSRNGEIAVVTIEVPGQPPSDYEFALLEGKWCPRSWVESAPRLEALKPMIAGVLQSDLIAKRKEVFMQDLDLVEQGINDLLDAKTAKEFNAYVDQAVIPFLTQRMDALRPAQPSAKSPAGDPTLITPDGVTVIVKGKLDEKAAESLSVQLAGLSDDTNLSVVFGPNAKGESTEFQVTPVADIEGFAARIDFGKVLAVDAEGKTVTVAAPTEKSDSR